MDMGIFREAAKMVSEMVDMVTPEPAPVVLELPTVPPNTVALVTVRGGNRWLRHGGNLTGVPSWKNEGTHEVLSLANLLQEEGPVRVELREPRTWPKLDGAPDDVRAVRGGSGTIYRRTSSGAPSAAYFTAEHNGQLTNFTPMTLSEIRETDGPVEEIIDSVIGAEEPPPWETQ